MRVRLVRQRRDRDLAQMNAAGFARQNGNGFHWQVTCQEKGCKVVHGPCHILFNPSILIAHHPTCHWIGIIRNSAWVEVAKLRVSKAGCLGSSRHQPASPQGRGIGPGGVALRASTPATRDCYPLMNSIPATRCTGMAVLRSPLRDDRPT